MTFYYIPLKGIKDRFKSKFKKEEVNPKPYWNERCRIACQEADEYIKKL